MSEKAVKLAIDFLAPMSLHARQSLKTLTLDDQFVSYLFCYPLFNAQSRIFKIPD